MPKKGILEKALKPMKSKCADRPLQDLAEQADLRINPKAVR